MSKLNCLKELNGLYDPNSTVTPITKAWLDGDMGGLLVLDGKGALPLEPEGLHSDYVLLSPKNGQFNAIQGMNPDAVADVLADVFSAEDGGKDKFWTDSARLMLRMAAIILHAHPTKAFNLPELQRFCVTTLDERSELIADVAEQIIDNPRLSMAVDYWLNELPVMPEQTQSSITNNIRTWLGNIVAHEVLGQWVAGDTQTTAQIEDVLAGAKIGLLLPESEYGTGGVAISALCMRRLYDAVKKRGDNWKNQAGQKPILLAADEVQNLLTKADLETVPVARSLGLYMMFATQNVDGLYKRLTKEGALQLLGNLASLIALPPRSEDSNKYVSERTGKIWKAATASYHALPDARADIGIYQNSGADISYREADLHRQSLYGAPRLSYAVNLWHRSFEVKAMGWLNDLVQSDATNLLNPKPILNLDLHDLIEPTEIDTLLARPFSAIAIINRGKVQRRDVILLGGAK